MADGGLLDKAGAYLDNLADKAAGNTREQAYEESRKKSEAAYKEGPKSKLSTVVAPLEPLHKAHGGAVPSLDFKEFKKVSSDEHSTVMRHPDGHELRISHYAEGGDVQDMSQASMPIAEDPGLSQELNAQAPNAIPGYGQAQAAPQAPTGPSNFEIPAQQAQETAFPQQSMAPMQSALAQQEKGVQEYGAAQGQQGKAEEAAAKSQVDAQQHIMSRFTENMKKYSQEADSVLHDIQAGHIDAGRYMKNLSTSSQVSTAIGLVLGGMGAGLTGGENPALKILQNNIDRDVQSQIHDTQNKQNLFHGLMQQMGNEKDAANMLHVITTGAYAAKLQEAAAKSKSPTAQAIADKSIGDLRMSVAPQMQQLAFTQAVRQGLQQGALTPEVAVQALVPQHHQKAVFDEIERAQDTRHMGGSILSSFDKAATDVRPTAGGRIKNMIPGVDSEYVNALHQAMQPTFKDLEGTVRQAAMDNTFHNITPQFGDSDQKIAVKRQALVDYLQSKASAPTAKGFGIDLNTFPSTAKMSGGAKPMKNAPRR